MSVTEQVLARLNDRAAALRAGGQALEQAKDAAFAAEGPGWAPLAESTVRERGSAHPILRRSGVYQRSWQAVYDDDSVALGSDDWRVDLHQSGTARMPARPLAIPAASVRTAAQAIARRLIGGGG
jgi:phage gpG-like protein